MVKGWECLWEVPGLSPNGDKNLPIKKSIIPQHLLFRSLIPFHGVSRIFLTHVLRLMVQNLYAFAIYIWFSTCKLYSVLFFCFFFCFVFFLFFGVSYYIMYYKFFILKKINRRKYIHIFHLYVAGVKY